MPPVGDIQRYLKGVWRMMTGRKDGIRLLDLSVDGFWNSFFAIIVALPVMLAGWAPLATEIAGHGASFGTRLSVVLRLAIVDLGSWLLPLIGLALLSGLIGIRDRLVHYIVASNWATALFAWFMLPTNLTRLFFPAADDAANGFALIVFIISLILSWRLTDAALEKGAAVTTGVFVAMLVSSIIFLITLQDLFGVVPIQ
jgi:hypothetical protein